MTKKKVQAPDRAKVRPTEDAMKAASRKGLDISHGTHGTQFTPGQTTVDPPAKVGVTQVFDTLSNPDKTYFTAAMKYPHIESSGPTGWDWASSASHARGEAPIAGGDHIVTGRPVMHHVEPEGEVDIDRNMGTFRFAEMTADRLNITDTEWIRPPQADELGVQGTLPNVNWNQFADRQTFSGIDTNNAGISEKTRLMKGTVEHDEATMRQKPTVQTFGLSSPPRRLRNGLPPRDRPAPDRPKVEQPRLPL